MLKDKLQADLKAAMLSGDKTRVSALNMLKGAVLNQEIAEGSRDVGLSDDQMIVVLTKEYKKRVDAAQLYKQAGNDDKASAEMFEAEVIATYLPAQLEDAELLEIIDKTIAQTGTATMQDMGKIIGSVKAQAGAAADGGRIANLVKAQLTK